MIHPTKNLLNKRYNPYICNKASGQCCHEARTHTMRHAYHRLFITLHILIVLSVLHASGQTFKQIATSDRLVNVIHRDTLGYVWLGTGQTLDRYDGVRVKSYPIPGDRINLKRVNDITSDPHGTVYIGNGEGIYRLPYGSNDMEPYAQKQISFPVHDLLFEGDTLFAATDRGVYLIAGNERHVERFMPRSDMLSPHNMINSVHPDSDPLADGLWLTSRSSLMYLNIGERIFTEYPNAAVNTEFLDIESVGDTLYIGTRGDGVIPFYTASRSYGDPINAGCNIITSLSTNSDGTLNIATDGDGIFFYSPRRGMITDHLVHDRLAAPGEGLSSNSVYSLMVDNEGLLWVGYYQSGADYTPASHRIFDTFSYSTYFNTSSMTVRALAMNGPEIVVGSREGFYYLNRDNGRTASFSVPAIGSNIIFAVNYSAAEGIYYIGTYGGGMYTFDASSLKVSKFNPVGPAFSHATIFAITTGPNGDMWVATSMGVYSFRGDKMRESYTYANSRLPEGNVYEIFFDSAGRGWFCTENGMAVMREGGRLSIDGFPKGFVNNQKIRDIYEDSEHTLYFVPDRGRVLRSNLELSRFEYMTLMSGSRAPTVTFITEDADSCLWIGTDDGLMRYDRHEEMRHFSRSDGLPSPVFTFCPPIRDNIGDLWMGCAEGLVHLDYARFKADTKAMPSPIITDVISGGRSLTGTLTGTRRHPVLMLDTDSRSFTVHFSDLCHSLIEDHKYEYMLEGYDDGWTLVSGDAAATFYDIPAGRYTFKVRQAGAPSTESCLSVRISHVFTTFEWALMAIAAMAAGAAVYMYIRHRRSETSYYTADNGDGPDSGAAAQPADTDMKYRTTRVSDEECRRLLRKLDTLMKAERPYTNPDLKSADLAAMIGATPHALSYLFNQHLRSNYYDYVNEYRVKAFCEMLSRDPNLVKYTISAMSDKCGFSSRASFFRYFKKFKGTTPAEYLKSLK